MKILVSNDDGWQSDGITSLYQAMCEIAEVKLVAPDRNCSAASSSLTLMNPVRATQHKADVYGCLLYTSPSPRDRTRSRMPSSA